MKRRTPGHPCTQFPPVSKSATRCLYTNDISGDYTHQGFGVSFNCSKNISAPVWEEISQRKRTQHDLRPNMLLLERHLHRDQEWCSVDTGWRLLLTEETNPEHTTGSTYHLHSWGCSQEGSWSRTWEVEAYRICIQDGNVWANRWTLTVEL